MHLERDPADAAFREEVRAFLRDALPPDMAQRNLRGFQPLVRMEMFDLTEVVVINHDNTSQICLNTALRSTGSSSPDRGGRSEAGLRASRSRAKTW